MLYRYRRNNETGYLCVDYAGFVIADNAQYRTFFGRNRLFLLERYLSSRHKNRLARYVKTFVIIDLPKSGNDNEIQFTTSFFPENHTHHVEPFGFCGSNSRTISNRRTVGIKNTRRNSVDACYRIRRVIRAGRADKTGIGIARINKTVRIRQRRVCFVAGRAAYEYTEFFEFGVHFVHEKQVGVSFASEACGRSETHIKSVYAEIRAISESRDDINGFCSAGIISEHFHKCKLGVRRGTADIFVVAYGYTRNVSSVKCGIVVYACTVGKYVGVAVGIIELKRNLCRFINIIRGETFSERGNAPDSVYRFFHVGIGKILFFGHYLKRRMIIVKSVVQNCNEHSVAFIVRMRSEYSRIVHHFGYILERSVALSVFFGNYDSFYVGQGFDFPYVPVTYFCRKSR